VLVLRVQHALERHDGIALLTKVLVALHLLDQLFADLFALHRHGHLREERLVLVFHYLRIAVQRAFYLFDRR